MSISDTARMLVPRAHHWRHADIADEAIHALLAVGDDAEAFPHLRVHTQSALNTVHLYAEQFDVLFPDFERLTGATPEAVDVYRHLLRALNDVSIAAYQVIAELDKAHQVKS